MTLRILAAALLLTHTGAGAAPRRFELADLNRLVRVSDPQIAPDGRTVAVVVSRADEEANRWQAEVVVVDVASGSLRPVTSGRTGITQPRWSPTGDRLAFLASSGEGKAAKAQVFVQMMPKGVARKLTSAPEGVQHYAWAPDGRSIAFVTADEPEKKTGVQRHNDSFEVENDDFLITEAARPSHIWLVPTEPLRSGPAGARTRAALGQSDRSGARRLTSGAWSLPVTFPPGAPSSPLSWSPDGTRIAFTRVASAHSGDRSRSTIQVLDVKSGAMRPVTGRERFEGYPVFSPDGSQISYWHPREGDRANVNDVHVTSAPGATGAAGSAAGRSVTHEIDRNIARAIWTPDGQSLLVGANDARAVSLWLQPLAGRARQLNLHGISPASAFWVDAVIGRDNAIAFVGSEPKRPAELYHMTGADAAPRRLTDLNAHIAALDLGSTEFIDWKGPDGTPSNGTVTYPADFSPSRKYPLVLVIHGGPRAASMLTFSGPAQLMAARGWVVFQPNYRGSDNLGNAYQRAIYNDAGEGPGRDVMAGLDALKKRGFVDETRVAVSGWSYGGYMTTWLLGHYDGWKAAVAGAPVTDWVDQYNLSDGNVDRGISLGGSPWVGDRMEAYRAQSPITYAARIRTPTLVMCNTGDYRVPITQSFKLYHALRDNGVEARFIAYPSGGHSPADPIRSQDVQRRWVEWLARFLEPGGSTSSAGR